MFYRNAFEMVYVIIHCDMRVRHLLEVYGTMKLHNTRISSHSVAITSASISAIFSKMPMMRLYTGSNKIIYKALYI